MVMKDSESVLQLLIRRKLGVKIAKLQTCFRNERCKYPLQIIKLNTITDVKFVRYNEIKYSQKEFASLGETACGKFINILKAMQIFVEF